jgi:hypothetical protein
MGSSNTRIIIGIIILVSVVVALSMGICGTDLSRCAI